MLVSPSDADVRPAAPTITLDRSGDPWIGTFPGLGTVRVWADGRVEAQAESADDGAEAGRDGAGAVSESAEWRIAALLHGWGEPLAMARQGFHIATATAVVPPGADQCLLISGDPHDTAIVMLGLATRGWRVLADRLTPVVIDGPGGGSSSGSGSGTGDGSGPGSGVIAHPRPGPVLASARRASKAGAGATAVRADTDAVAVDVPRADTPHPVAALVTARTRRPHDPVLAELRGHRRVETANTLFASGALAPDTAGSTTDAAPAMARTMRVAALPMATVHIDPADPAPAVDALVEWWTSR